MEILIIPLLLYALFAAYYIGNTICTRHDPHRHRGDEEANK